MKIEEKEIWAIVIEESSSCMGQYYPEDDYCTVYYAQTQEEYDAILTKFWILAPIHRENLKVYKLKALVVDGYPYIKAPDADIRGEDSFADRISELFLNKEEIHSIYYKSETLAHGFIQEIIKRPTYQRILEERRRAEEKAQATALAMRKAKEAKEAKEKERKEEEEYERLKKKFG